MMQNSIIKNLLKLYTIIHMVGKKTEREHTSILEELFLDDERSDLHLFIFKFFSIIFNCYKVNIHYFYNHKKG